jgi:hypothetical protein
MSPSPALPFFPSKKEGIRNSNHNYSYLSATSGEDCRIRANADGEREHGNSRKARALQEETN